MSHSSLKLSARDVQKHVAALHAIMDNARERLNTLVLEFKAMIQDPFNQERLTLFGIGFWVLLIGYFIIRVLLARIRARAYFKFFGKRKRIKQLKGRVLAGNY